MARLPHPRFGAHVSVAGGIDLAPERAAAIGADTYQIFVKSSRQWAAGRLRRATVESFRARHRELIDGPVFAHGNYLVNLAAPDTSIRERSIRVCRLELERCRRLGLDGLVIHPGAHRGLGVEQGLDRVARALARVLQGASVGESGRARDAGQARYQLEGSDRSMSGAACPILLETTAGQGTVLGSRLEELAWLLARFDSDQLGVCLDSCHLHAAGYRLDKADHVREALNQIDDIVGFERIRAIHLNDSAGKAGSRLDRHRGIGEGKIGSAGFRALLCDPWIRRLPGILETPKGDGDALDLRNLRKLHELAAG